MSTSIHVAWDCSCEPSKRTGWICSDTDTVYCNTCEGVIANTSHITVAELQRYRDNFNREHGLAL